MNWRRLNIEPYSPLKPTNVGFILIGPNSLSRVEDLATVNHVTQLLSSELGLKVGFKELRLEPKFLNRRLWKPCTWFFLNGRNLQILLYKENNLKMINFMKQKHEYIIHTWSAKLSRVLLLIKHVTIMGVTWKYV